MIEVYNKTSEQTQGLVGNSCQHCGISLKTHDEACATCASWIDVARYIEATRRVLREVAA